MAKASDILEGLAILVKQDPESEVSAEEEVIYAGGDNSNPGNLSQADQDKLEDLGWHWDGEEFDCWLHFT